MLKNKNKIKKKALESFLISKALLIILHFPDNSFPVFVKVTELKTLKSIPQKRDGITFLITQIMTESHIAL